jgi:hypothetical protein
MRPGLPDLGPHADTFVAVVLGALLATISGVVGNQLEALMRRRERERSAALLFGEVLSTMRVLLEGAADFRRRDPPYGPVTRRMLRAARREIDIYERNREALVDLRDARLRTDVHALTLRIAMPLDGLLDSLSGVDPAAAGPGGEISGDEARDRGFAFMMSNVDQISALVARLGRISRHSFDHFETAAIIRRET